MQESREFKRIQIFLHYEEILYFYWLLTLRPRIEYTPPKFLRLYFRKNVCTIITQENLEEINVDVFGAEFNEGDHK